MDANIAPSVAMLELAVEPEVLICNPFAALAVDPYLLEASTANDEQVEFRVQKANVPLPGKTTHA